MQNHQKSLSKDCHSKGDVDLNDRHQRGLAGRRAAEGSSSLDAFYTCLHVLWSWERMLPGKGDGQGRLLLLGVCFTLIPPYCTHAKCARIYLAIDSRKASCRRTRRAHKLCHTWPVPVKADVCVLSATQVFGLKFWKLVEKRANICKILIESAGASAKGYDVVVIGRRPARLLCLVSSEP